MMKISKAEWEARAVVYREAARHLREEVIYKPWCQQANIVAVRLEELAKRCLSKVRSDQTRSG